MISLYLVDRIGRRKLYFIGLSGIAFSVLCLSACFIYANQLGEIGRWLMVIFMFGYVAFFAISIGPFGMVGHFRDISAEVRGLGTSIGSLAVWIFNCIVSFTFFKIIDFFLYQVPKIVVGQTTSENPAGAFFFMDLLPCWVWYGVFILAGDKRVIIGGD